MKEHIIKPAGQREGSLLAATVPLKAIRFMFIATGCQYKLLAHKQLETALRK
jgi:hypothetical protein